MLLFATVALAPLLFAVASRSRKTIILSVALTPVLLGVLAANDPHPRRGLTMLLLAVGAFDVVYAFLLYYVWLRLPWEG